MNKATLQKLKSTGLLEKEAVLPAILGGLRLAAPIARMGMRYLWPAARALGTTAMTALSAKGAYDETKAAMDAEDWKGTLGHGALAALNAAAIPMFGTNAIRNFRILPSYAKSSPVMDALNSNPAFKASLEAAKKGPNQKYIQSLIDSGASPETIQKAMKISKFRGTPRVADEMTHLRNLEKEEENVRALFNRGMTDPAWAWRNQDKIPDAADIAKASEWRQWLNPEQMKKYDEWKKTMDSYNALDFKMKKALQKATPDIWLKNVERPARRLMKGVPMAGMLAVGGTQAAGAYGADKLVASSEAEKMRQQQINENIDVDNYDQYKQIRNNQANGKNVAGPRRINTKLFSPDYLP